MKSHSSMRKMQARVRKLSKGAQDRSSVAMGGSIHSRRRAVLSDEHWLQEMRRMMATISCHLDELELIWRAVEVLERKQVVRSWFNRIVPALGARPIDLCQTARGRRAVLRELGRIEHGVHS